MAFDVKLVATYYEHPSFQQLYPHELKLVSPLGEAW